MENSVKLRKAIEAKRKTLIRKAQTKGLYENFGQREVRELEDKYLDLSDYSEDGKLCQNLIGDFDNWCMTYEG